jgi:hypothetical protein
VFAALVEPRPYKAGMAQTAAVARMRALAGKVDPMILWMLEKLVAAGKPVDGGDAPTDGGSAESLVTRSPVRRLRSP